MKSIKLILLIILVLTPYNYQLKHTKIKELIKEYNNKDNNKHIQSLIENTINKFPNFITKEQINEAKQVVSEYLQIKTNDSHALEIRYNKARIIKINYEIQKNFLDGINSIIQEDDMSKLKAVGINFNILLNKKWETNNNDCSKQKLNEFLQSQGLKQDKSKSTWKKLRLTIELTQPNKESCEQSKQNYLKSIEKIESDLLTNNKNLDENNDANRQILAQDPNSSSANPTDNQSKVEEYKEKIESLKEKNEKLKEEVNCNDFDVSPNENQTMLNKSDSQVVVDLLTFMSMCKETNKPALNSASQMPTKELKKLDDSNVKGASDNTGLNSDQKRTKTLQQLNYIYYSWKAKSLLTEYDNKNVSVSENLSEKEKDELNEKYNKLGKSIGNLGKLILIVLDDKI